LLQFQTLQPSINIKTKETTQNKKVSSYRLLKEKEGKKGVALRN